MSIKLTDLKMFAQLETELRSVSQEELAALKPGRSVPEKAEIIGELSHAMKGLLCLRNTAMSVSRPVVATLQCGNEVTEQQLDLARKAKFYDNLFWVALAREFPAVDKSSFGYGPNFEVYRFDPVPAK